MLADPNSIEMAQPGDAAYARHGETVIISADRANAPGFLYELVFTERTSQNRAVMYSHRLPAATCSHGRV